jgi:hypothetical protein
MEIENFKNYKVLLEKRHLIFHILQISIQQWRTLKIITKLALSFKLTLKMHQGIFPRY